MIWGEESPGREIVWLTEQRHYAVLINRGAFFSEVKFYRDGIEYIMEIENDEYEMWEDRATDYESD